MSQPLKNLPVLMGALRQEEADGELVLEQNDGLRRFFLSKGELVHLTSDVAGEQFGGYLLRQGVLDFKALNELLANDERYRIGEKVIQWGMMSLEERDSHLQALQAQIMVHALEHPVLSWSFSASSLERSLEQDLHFKLEHKHFIWNTFQESHYLMDLLEVLDAEADWKWVGREDLMDSLSDLPLTPGTAYALSFLSADPISFETFQALSNLEEDEAGRFIVTLWALGALVLAGGTLPVALNPGRPVPTAPPPAALPPLDFTTPPKAVPAPLGAPQLIIPLRPQAPPPGALPLIMPPAGTQARPPIERPPTPLPPMPLPPMPLPPMPAPKAPAPRLAPHLDLDRIAQPEFIDLDPDPPVKPKPKPPAKPAPKPAEPPPPPPPPTIAPLPPPPPQPPPPPPQPHLEGPARARQLLRNARQSVLQDRTVEAVRTLEQAAQLDPEHDVAYEIWLMLGQLRLTNPAWSTRAIDALQTASRLRPKAAEPWTAMGEIYHRKGFHTNAVACFKKAIELDPSVPVPPDVDLDDPGPAPAPAQPPPRKGLFGKIGSILGPKKP